MVINTPTATSMTTPTGRAMPKMVVDRTGATAPSGVMASFGVMASEYGRVAVGGVGGTGGLEGGRAARWVP